MVLAYKSRDFARYCRTKCEKKLQHALSAACIPIPSVPVSRARGRVFWGTVGGIGVSVGWRRWTAVLVQVRSRGGKGKVAGGAAREWMVGVMSAAFFRKDAACQKEKP